MVGRPLAHQCARQLRKVLKGKKVKAEFGNVLVKGKRVYSRRLLDLSFEFELPDPRAVLTNLHGQRQ